MSDTMNNMRKKIDQTENLGSVVHTMKALAASKIGQYEDSVQALEEYYRTIVLGLSVCLRDSVPQAFPGMKGATAGVVVFGSDQGLVGRFNESLTEFVAETLGELPGNKKIWAVGERIEQQLREADLPVEKLHRLPGSVGAITPLIGQLLLEIQLSPFYIFFNRPRSGATYEPHMQRMLPLDEKWVREMTGQDWPTRQLPEVLGKREQTLGALIREYLFVTLFKACAESLTAENTSRLAAMQRAEKNIDEMLEDLEKDYHQVRQNSIDEELFDIVSGFEALGKKAG